MEYSLTQFQSDIQNVGPRPFDQYILPVFLLGYAIRSKKPMGKTARRILFSAGIYMFYRNYVNYKKLIQEITAKFPQNNPETTL